jgi:hypothetical protein
MNALLLHTGKRKKTSQGVRDMAARGKGEGVFKDEEDMVIIMRSF